MTDNEFQLKMMLTGIVGDLINNHHNEIIGLFKDDDLVSIFDKHNQNRLEHENAGFNIFNLISDKYYYENLHSDIISAFLDSKGAHNEGSRFLKLFLGLINKLRPELKINFEEFNDTSTFRENYRIDILIRDNISNKSIIIENKIYNASDTYRQLPTYVNEIGKKNVVAVVYLPLDQYKKPDETGWRKDEIEFINSKLVCLPVYNRTEYDFYSGWLLKCFDEATEDEVKTIIKQYSKLILKIGGFRMDKYLYEKFYTKVVEQNDFFKTALSIKEFVEKLPEYRANRIYDIFLRDYSPFRKIRINGTAVLFEGYSYMGRTFTVHLNCLIDRYELKFWDEKWTDNINGQQVNIQYTSGLLEKLPELKFDEKRTDEYVKWFSFPMEEQYIYAFITLFKDRLLSISEAKI